jgi:hypothetical protein
MALTPFTRDLRGAKKEKLVALPGFTGDAPGGPSRWSTARSAEWQPLRPKLAVEVRYDHVTGNRFRHGVRDHLSSLCTQMPSTVSAIS